MPKIAIVSEYFYPLLGGITENVYNTAIRLAARGWQVKIITSRASKQEPIIPSKPWLNNQPKFEIIRIGQSVPVYANGSWGRFTVGLKLISELKNIFKEEKFDLVHIHSPLVPTLPYLALQLARSPVVGTFHTYFDNNLFHDFLYGLLKSRLQKDLNRINRQLFVSQSCVTPLAKYFELKPEILPNGVDTNEFSPEVPPLEKFSRDKLNLLFVGRFDPRNGLDVMLEAFNLIKTEFKDVRLIVVGGPVKKRYLEMVKPEFREDVFFEGPILEQRPNYYAACDIFCSPVDKASFGITLLEAMASGKPIVATENIGYNEILEPEESIVVARKSPQALANAVLSLLRDEALRKKMGAKGREKALKYSWDEIVPGLEKIYLSLLGDR
ncbi:MAG: glycosyltransferase family 4 protein [Candidatus Aminicenantes bacterium]|nr:glycosyltransferase family 4 protein [Candidatus Aminicenantes bacterium]